MRSISPVYNRIRNKLHSMQENEQGATMIEYAFMVMLIAAVAVATVTLIGTNVTAAFNAFAGFF